MSFLIPLFLVATAFVTAALSGVFGMAGGLVLMGALALVLPVSAAFVTHGILQLVANGWRAILFEYRRGDLPSTDLGREEAAWAAGR